MANSLLGALLKNESGGRNVANTTQGTSSGQAQGYFQITTGTWNDFGGQKYAPSPLQASYEQQADIASKIPLKRWDESTVAMMRATGKPIDPNKTLGENLAANGENLAPTPRISGPVEAAGGGRGSDVGAKQLYGPPPVEDTGAAPVVVVNQTPAPDFTPDSNPWTGLGSMLASSVDPNKPQFLSADPDEALPAIPEFDSALPTPQQMPPTPLLDALAPGTPPLGEVFKVAEIGKAAVPKLDEFGRRVRQRQYG